MLLVLLLFSKHFYFGGECPANFFFFFFFFFFALFCWTTTDRSKRIYSHAPFLYLIPGIDQKEIPLLFRTLNLLFLVVNAFLLVGQHRFGCHPSPSIRAGRRTCFIIRSTQQVIELAPFFFFPQPTNQWMDGCITGSMDVSSFRQNSSLSLSYGIPALNVDNRPEMMILWS